MPDLDALLTEADEHVASVVNSFAEGSFMRGRILAGEGADQRLALVVRLAAALRSVRVPVAEEPEQGLGCYCVNYCECPKPAPVTEEWEYGIYDPSSNEVDECGPGPISRDQFTGIDWERTGESIVRRRPAGPWEPVPSPGTTTEEE